MTDSRNPTPTELRELARRWTAPHAPHPLIGAAACDVCLAGAEILSFPRLGRQIVALVDRLERVEEARAHDWRGEATKEIAYPMTTPLLPQETNNEVAS